VRSTFSHCIQRVPLIYFTLASGENGMSGRKHQHIRAHSTYGLVTAGADGVFFLCCFFLPLVMAGNNRARGEEAWR
jgi:hypothetical protein